jgi:hypothetical protein
MADDAYDQRLALLEKLTASKPQPRQMPTGGVDIGGSDMSLIELKEKDPVAYKRKIREQLTGKGSS